MKILLYFCMFLIPLLVYKLLKNFEKNIFITIICSLTIIQIILTPKLCIDSALLGANLFITKVFPSLFPFLVISGIMIDCDGVTIYSKILGKFLCKPLRLPIECTFAIVISMFCGYPLGAKYSCDLYEKGIINYKTCQRLINIASNASPLFIIGSVGTAMLKNFYIGYFLLLCNYISCFIMAFIIPADNTYISRNQNINLSFSNKNIGDIIKSNIENAIKTSFSVGGFVIIFSVITNIIKSNIFFDIAIKNVTNILQINKNLIEGLLLGIIEMTNGCYLISSLSTDIYIKIIIISFLLGFSGFSIVSQVYSFTYKYNLSMKKYILRKFMQGLISSTIAAVLYKIPFLNLSMQVFSNKYSFNQHVIILMLFIIFLIVPFILSIIKKLFHAS